MYIYCIAPYGKIKPNFIKIGPCPNINSLKKRYSTYYGLSHRSYYVKVDNNEYVEGAFSHYKISFENYRK